MRTGRPKLNRPPTKIYPVRFEVEDLSHLEELASYGGDRSVASIIREAVKAYLRLHPRYKDDFSDLLAFAEPAPSPKVQSYRDFVTGIVNRSHPNLSAEEKQKRIDALCEMSADAIKKDE